MVNDQVFLNVTGERHKEGVTEVEEHTASAEVLHPRVNKRRQIITSITRLDSTQQTFPTIRSKLMEELLWNSHPT